jgi:hypothetical protein
MRERAMPMWEGAGSIAKPHLMLASRHEHAARQIVRASILRFDTVHAGQPTHKERVVQHQPETASVPPSRTTDSLGPPP